MYSPALAAHVARVYDLCDVLHSRLNDEGRRGQLLAALAALAELAKIPPAGAPPLVMGLLNQAHALAEISQYRLGECGRLPTPQAQEALKRSLVQLMLSLNSLRVAVEGPTPRTLDQTK